MDLHSFFLVLISLGVIVTVVFPTKPLKNIKMFNIFIN